MMFGPGRTCDATLINLGSTLNFCVKVIIINLGVIMDSYFKPDKQI